MSDGLTTWHYGLMAERWAEFVTDAPELEYFSRAIVTYGQPALDLACGTGRLLLPLLRAGLEVDGCDVSADMLDHCRRKAAGAGLRPNLYRQPMHALGIPRRYRTIILCDSFGLAGSRENDLEAIRRCHAHLEPGGALLLNIQAEYASADEWGLWTADGRRSLPQPWPGTPHSQVSADGAEHRAAFRMTEVNPLEQSYRRQVRLEKWVEGRLVASEERELQGNMYLKPEVHLMLKAAGFREIAVTGDYTGDPADPEHEEVNFTAIR